MARKAREQSSMGVYHAILRGVNKQQIFECNEDYERFEQALRKQTQHYWDEGEWVGPHCAIYAYCLMGNHVHLLIKEVDESIGDTMKRIASSYVYYYNHKYGRVGHLFQERFRSQPVGNWDYFVTLLRYVYQNPIKAGIVNHIQEYAWSSWKEYSKDCESGFCSLQPVSRRISQDELLALVEELLPKETERGLLDYDRVCMIGSLCDDDVWMLLEGLGGMRNAADFQSLPRPKQKHILYQAHQEGVGPRTLSRLTGVPYGIVQRAVAVDRLDSTTDGVSEDDIIWELKCPDY